ncbi:MAG TPA: site-2 protease family protein [Candidatus Babeliales bacterium]|nr:site-2 protease family protein [Candidatus Babeliales bacterium]
MICLSNLLIDGLFIVAGLLGIGFLIAIHEFGHFLFCKLFKISTPSFSIGMGPVIFKRKIGETVFSLSALPIGGYVEIAGNEEVGQGDQAQAKRNDQYSFANKPYYQKLLVMIGGILFNTIFAYLALTLVFMAGMPKTPILFPDETPAVVGLVKPGSAADQAGLKIGDHIYQINETTIKSTTALNKIIQAAPAQPTRLHVIRDGQNIELLAIPNTITAKNKQIGQLGIGFQEPKDFEILPAQSIITSIQSSFTATNELIYKTYLSFKGLFEQKSVDNIGGPISVIFATVQGAKKGLKYFLILLSLISINLAVLNIIPIPIMDGGQILFVTIEAIIKRPIPEKIRLAIHYACWVLILALIAYLSFGDCKRIFWDKILNLFAK